MLKIKDNVDLKELKKFGFKKNKYNNYEKKLNPVNGDFIIINGYNRKFYCGIGATEPRLNTLFDLIQAGLVEKV